jgi:hypothetical protein
MNSSTKDAFGSVLGSGSSSKDGSAYREEDEEEWPKWTAQRGTGLTLDNVPLVDVFKRIQTQLEILRKRPIFDPRKIPAPAPAVAPIMADRKASMRFPSMKEPGSAPPFLPVVSEPIPLQVFEQIDTSMFLPRADYDDMMAAFEERLLQLETREVAPANLDPLLERFQALEDRLADNEQTVRSQKEDMQSYVEERHLQLSDKVPVPT